MCGPHLEVIHSMIFLIFSSYVVILALGLWLTLMQIMDLNQEKNPKDWWK
jgi:hypothetical protein